LVGNVAFTAEGVKAKPGTDCTEPIIVNFVWLENYFILSLFP